MTASEPMTNERGKRICGAQRCHGRGVCQSIVLYANGRCRVHGGPNAALSGPRAPNWRGGTSFKRYPLPKRMLEAFEDALGDPDLLSLRQDIALAESIIADLLPRLETGESGAAWRALATAWDGYERAKYGSGEWQGYRQRIAELLEQGVGEQAARDELGEWQERKGRAQERERKRLVEMQQCLTHRELLALLAQTIDIVCGIVTDPDARREIARQIGLRAGVHSLPVPRMEDVS